MKSINSLVLSVAFLILALSSCQDTITVVDSNFEFSRGNWSYTEKVSVPVNIDTADIDYNLYFNMRHTSEYKYSNIFILIHTISPDGKKTTERREFKLAMPDGEWLGSGSGNLYSYQLLFKKKYKFREKGKYIFELEQNMRDNPLDHVTDAGLRVEKAM